MNMSSKTHPLMTVEEAADNLRLSKHTIHNWLSQGRLHRVKLGSITFLDRDEVERFLTEARKNGRVG